MNRLSQVPFGLIKKVVDIHHFDYYTTLVVTARAPSVSSAVAVPGDWFTPWSPGFPFWSFHPKMPRIKTTSVRIESGLYKRLSVAAKAQHRSTHSQMIYILNEWDRAHPVSEPSEPAVSDMDRQAVGEAE